MGSRAPTATSYRDTPYARQKREEKACLLEHFAWQRGYRAVDVERDDVREELLGDLAKHRGKTRSQVSASLDTWRLVWKFLRDRERPVAVPAPASPLLSDEVHDPFARLPGGGR